MSRLLFASLFFLSGAAFAADNVTAIYTDSQFTASRYGRSVAQECLNPSHIKDAKQVQIFSNPGGSTSHLLQDIKLPILESGQSFVRRYLAEGSGDDLNVQGPKRTLHTNPRYYFRSRLQHEDVNRVMIFLGINEVTKRNNNWVQIAEEVRVAGKQCIISLPTLSSNSEMNEKILSYNRYVAHLLEETRCHLVDPSNTLEEDEKQHITFDTDSAGIHITDASSGSAARATCRAFAEAFGGPENIDPAEEPEAPDDSQQENPVPGESFDFDNIDTDDLPFWAPAER